jgi:hypothetical protein
MAGNCRAPMISRSNKSILPIMIPMTFSVFFKMRKYEDEVEILKNIMEVLLKNTDRLIR